MGEEQLGPSVYFDGHRFLLFYSTRISQQWVLFAATSFDGIKWIPVNNHPVLEQAPENNFDSAGPGGNQSVHPSQLVFIGPRVFLWYGGEDSEPPNRQRIGLMETFLKD
jgi:hypothetical protein